MVPSRFMARCELCGKEINTGANGVFQWTSGWVMQREGGGGHGISLPKRENRWACRDCVESHSKGTAGQAKMF